MESHSKVIHPQSSDLSTNSGLLRTSGQGMTTYHQNSLLSSSQSSLHKPNHNRTNTQDDLKKFEQQESISKKITEIKGEKQPPRPLTSQERDMAQVLIDREHPLQDLLIWDTLPCLRRCKKRLPDFIPNQTEGDLDSSSSEDEAAASVFDSSVQLNQNDDEASKLI